MPRLLPSGKALAQTPDPETQEEEPPDRLLLWKEMLQHQTEEAVVEVMDDLLKRVIDGCFQVDIRQQMTSYSTNWVKHCLVQTVEQNFLIRDEGDEPDDVPLGDTEPPTAKPDAWATGCVPLLTPSPPLKPISAQDTDVVQKLGVPRKHSSVPKPKVSQKLPTKKSSPDVTVANINECRRSFPQTKAEKKKNQLPPAPKPSKFLPPLSQSTEKKTLIAEKSVYAKRSPPVIHKESAPVNVTFKHKATQKLDPATLPDHCVFPKYEIVESKTKMSSNKLQQKHSKREPEWPGKSQRPEVDVRPKHRTVMSTGPLRLEAMALAKGVTLSRSLDLNQSMGSSQTPPVKLRPIRTEPAPFKFSIDQFFAADPQVKPLSQTQ